MQIDVGGLLAPLVVLLGVLDHAGGAEGHQALSWVTIGVRSVQKLVRNSVEW